MNPRESGRFIRDNTDDDLIRIDGDGVERVARMIYDEARSNGLKNLDYVEHELHPRGADEKAIDWIFLMDVINFSFWERR